MLRYLYSVVVVVIVLLDAANALSQRSLWRETKTTKQQQQQQQQQDTVDSFIRGSSKKKNTDHTDNDVQQLIFTQRLDHFNGADSRTFSQRYFYSSRHVPSHDNNNNNNNNNNNSSTPILALLCVGGEGPTLEKSVLVDSVHCSGDMLEFAKTVHDTYPIIHLFALEHRYYGHSYPTFTNTNAKTNTNSHRNTTLQDFWFDEDDDDDDADDQESLSPVSNRHLIYLSSRQALADLSHFMAHHERLWLQQNDSNNRKVHWIVFGGSYPGMLAAWVRFKYPHQVLAAVSNSAPIQPVLNFRSYNAHVAKEWADPIIGGSNDCLHIIQQGHEELVHAITSKNTTRRANIATAFDLCDADALLDDWNIQLFVGDGVLSHFTMQENDPHCRDRTNRTFCNIQTICQGLLDYVTNQTTVSNATDTNTNTTMSDSPNMDALIWLHHQVHDTINDGDDDDDDCWDISWKDTVDYIADPIRGQSGGVRSWLWQTCTEFGFYQTCETNSTCPYGRGWHPLEQDLILCEQAFGIPKEQVIANIQETIEYYGGWHLTATNVLSVTGSVDPWSELALHKTDNTKERPVYNVPGASHHFWTHAVKESDGIEIQEARKIIFDTLRGWLDDTERKHHGTSKAKNHQLETITEVVAAE